MEHGASRAYKVIVVAVVAAAAVVGVVVKAGRGREAPTPLAPPSPLPEEAEGTPSPAPSPIPALPRLIDLGRGECIPCKMMQPILEELAQEYKGRVDVDIVDIDERPEEADRWGVYVIPTQIFLDAQGNEVFRHEGFLPKEDILAVFEEMGVSLSPAATATPGVSAAPSNPASKVRTAVSSATRGSSQRRAVAEARLPRSRPVSTPNGSQAKAPAASTAAPETFVDGQDDPAAAKPNSAQTLGAAKGQAATGATCACQLPGWIGTDMQGSSKPAPPEEGVQKGEKPDVEQAP